MDPKLIAKLARDPRGTANEIVQYEKFSVAKFREAEDSKKSPIVEIHCHEDCEVNDSPNAMALPDVPFIGHPGWDLDEYVLIFADGTKRYSKKDVRERG